MSADIVSQPARHRTDRGYREEVIRKMRASGCRITHQRELIVGVILENKYPTIKEIYNEVKKMDPGVGFATVYRMVSLLEQIGVITRGITVNYSSLDPEHTMTSARKI